MPASPRPANVGRYPSWRPTCSAAASDAMSFRRARAQAAGVTRKPCRGPCRPPLVLDLGEVGQRVAAAHVDAQLTGVDLGDERGELIGIAAHEQAERLYVACGVLLCGRRGGDDHAAGTDQGDQGCHRLFPRLRCGWRGVKGARNGPAPRRRHATGAVCHRPRGRPRLLLAQELRIRIHAEPQVPAICGNPRCAPDPGPDASSIAWVVHSPRQVPRTVRRGRV